MSDKPKIYGFCPAGCRWETVHKDEFNKSATWIKQYANESGVFELSPFYNYKIVSPVSSDAYSCVISLSYTDSTAQTYLFTISEYDAYRNYFFFEILSLTATETAMTIVYEINGNRYSETVSGTAIDITNAKIKITGATEVFIFNIDASIKAEKGDKGDKGDKGEKGEDLSDELAGVQRQVDGLYAILLQKSEIYSQTLTATYATRQTAYGANIADGVQTTVSKIRGNTISVDATLKNATFKSILSTGKNLVNTDGLFDVGTSYNGLTCSKNADGTYKLSGTATTTFSYGSPIPCCIPKGSTIYFTPFYNVTTSAEGSYKLIGLALYNKNGILVKQWNSSISSGATTSFTIIDDVAKACFVWNVSGSTGLAVTIDNIKFMLSYENTNVFEPYKSDSINCNSNLELAEFDYVVPSENKVYRQSETITFDGSSDESFYLTTINEEVVFSTGVVQHGQVESVNDGLVANIAGITWGSGNTTDVLYIPSSSVGSVTTVGELRTYLSTHNLVVTYKKDTVTTENVSFNKADYTAYLNGSESVIQGDNGIGAYGEKNTVTQDYYLLTAPQEVSE